MSLGKMSSGPGGGDLDDAVGPAEAGLTDIKIVLQKWGEEDEQHIALLNQRRLDIKGLTCKVEHYLDQLKITNNAAEYKWAGAVGPGEPGRTDAPAPTLPQEPTEMAKKMLAMKRKWAALKQEVTQTRLKEMRNTGQYSLAQDNVRVAFERQAGIVSILNTIDASGSDGIFLQPVYGNSAMADLPNRPAGSPDRDTILRKNILYLAHAVEYVGELTCQLTQIGFITLFERDDIQQHDEELTQCVALFVKLFKKELTTNIVSRLVGVLYLTANTAAADVLMEVKRYRINRVETPDTVSDDIEDDPDIQVLSESTISPRNNQYQDNSHKLETRQSIDRQMTWLINSGLEYREKQKQLNEKIRLEMERMNMEILKDKSDLPNDI